LALPFLISTYCFVLEPGMVPTGSMENTVLIGDHLLLWKLPYGPQVPLTHWRLPRLRTPQSGEIVAFRSPEDANDIYLKRVIAVAGDTVEIRRGTLFVNSVPVPERYANVRANRRSTWQENIPPERVPVREIFVLGDNRDNSEDSRYFGPVAADSVLGEPLLVFWSYDAPSSAWLDPNPLHQVRLYASALEHVITQTRWRRTGLLLVLK
jgi:signal peptidase I